MLEASVAKANLNVHVRLTEGSLAKTEKKITMAFNFHKLNYKWLKDLIWDFSFSLIQLPSGLD